MSNISKEEKRKIDREKLAQILYDLKERGLDLSKYGNVDYKKFLGDDKEAIDKIEKELRTFYVGFEGEPKHPDMFFLTISKENKDGKPQFSGGWISSHYVATWDDGEMYFSDTYGTVSLSEERFLEYCRIREAAEKECDVQKKQVDDNDRDEL